MSLDPYLPAYLVREVHYASVHASPADTYDAFCGFDMAQIPWVRGLFQLRTILERSGQTDFHLTLRDAYNRGKFLRLKEIPNEELTVGAIGKIWRPVIPFEKVDPESFGTFRQPGFGKVAWMLQCRPRVEGGTLVRFELRVGATDTFSAAKMRGYYSLIGPFSRAIRNRTLREISGKLGDILAEEQKRTLPGDEIIGNAVGSATHAITIEAPATAVWPWLIQMGQQRAGWYSYDWLDHGGIPSAARIIPQLQQAKEGDLLNAGPNPDSGFFVLALDPPQTLVLGACLDVDTGKAFRPDVPVQPAHYLCSTWAFHLQKETEDITRLIVRARLDYSGSETLKGQFRRIFMHQLHGFMERKQLENIKRRAEQFSIAA